MSIKTQFIIGKAETASLKANIRPKSWNFAEKTVSKLSCSYSSKTRISVLNVLADVLDAKPVELTDGLDDSSPLFIIFYPFTSLEL